MLFRSLADAFIKAADGFAEAMDEYGMEYRTRSDEERKLSELPDALAAPVRKIKEAAEAVVAGLGLLSRYPDLEIEKKDLGSDFFEKRNALSKVHLIGKESTVRALLSFNQELSSAVLRLSLRRNPLAEMRSGVLILDEQIQKFGAERDRMVEIMKHLNFDGNIEEHRWTFANETFEFERKRVEAAMAERKALLKKLHTEWVSFAQECFDTATSLSLLLPPAIKAVREELNLPLDYAAYMREFERAVERDHDELSRYFSALQDGNSD